MRHLMHCQLGLQSCVLPCSLVTATTHITRQPYAQHTRSSVWCDNMVIVDSTLCATRPVGSSWLKSLVGIAYKALVGSILHAPLGLQSIEVQQLSVAACAWHTTVSSAVQVLTLCWCVLQGRWACEDNPGCLDGLSRWLRVQLRPAQGE